MNDYGSFDRRVLKHIYKGAVEDADLKHLYRLPRIVRFIKTYILKWIEQTGTMKETQQTSQTFYQGVTDPEDDPAIRTQQLDPSGEGGPETR